MARSMRTRKEVDYSDPGVLSLAEIRRGSLGASPREDNSPADSTSTRKVKPKRVEGTNRGFPFPKETAYLVAKTPTEAGATVLNQDTKKTTPVDVACDNTARTRPSSQACNVTDTMKAGHPKKVSTSTVTSKCATEHAVPGKGATSAESATPAKRVSSKRVSSAPPKVAAPILGESQSRSKADPKEQHRKEGLQQKDQQPKESVKRSRGRPSTSGSGATKGNANADSGEENAASAKMRCTRTIADERSKDSHEQIEGDASKNTPSPTQKSKSILDAGESPPTEAAATTIYDLPASPDEQERPKGPRLSWTEQQATGVDDIPTPPQVPKRRSHSSPTERTEKVPTLDRGAHVRSPGKPMKTSDQDEVDAERGVGTNESNIAMRTIRACPSRDQAKVETVPTRRGVGPSNSAAAVGNSRKSNARASGVTKSTPSKRQRTTMSPPSTPGLGVPALPPRVARPLPSPGTPAVTPAQEKFLSELRLLIGSLGEDVESGCDGNDVGSGTAAMDSASSNTGRVESAGDDVLSPPSNAERLEVEGKTKGKGASSEEVEYWKGRFEELSSLRETVPEMQLELFREHAAQRERAAQKLINHLRKQVVKSKTLESGMSETTASVADASRKKTLVIPPPPSLPQEVALASPTAAPGQPGDNVELGDELHSPTSSAYIRSLEEKLDHHRKIIQVYQNLSSLAMHVQPRRSEDGASADDGDGDEEVMTCTAVNHLHRRAVRFDLRIPTDEDSEDFVYLATGNKHLLPEYMQHELSFSKQQCPLFLTKLLQNLFRTSSTD